MNVSLMIYYQKLFILYIEALKKIMFVLFVERSKWYCRGSCWYSLYIHYLFGKAKSMSTADRLYEITDADTCK